MHEFEVYLKEEEKDICELCDTLEEKARHELSKDVSKVNAEELGEVVDMIKDLYEAKEKLYKACYYKHLVKAMEEEKEEREEEKKSGVPMRMYYPIHEPVTGSGRLGRMGGMWEPETDYERKMMERGRKGTMAGDGWDGTSREMRGPARDGAPKTRYGFSFDGYMEAREMYSATDPDQKRMRMESLNRDLDELVEMGKEVVMGMSPDEKQVWKTKISKILNA